MSMNSKRIALAGTADFDFIPARCENVGIVEEGWLEVAQNW